MECSEAKLPIDILSQVARGKQELRVMRFVSKRWKAAFDASVTMLSMPLRAGGPSPLDLRRRFPKLAKLHLTGLGISDHDLASLGPPPLQSCGLVIHIKLQHCIGLRHAGLARLVGWPITVLDIPDDGQVTVAGVSPIAALPLTHLSCSADGLTDAGAAQLLAPLRLTRLKMYSCSGLTDAALACLAAMPLHQLELSSCDAFSGAAFARLGALPLKNLELTACRHLTDATLASWARLSLTRLDLSMSRITDAGLANLGAQPLLQLSLSFCQKLTSAGLAHVGRLTTLTALELTWCKQLTDDGLAHLRQLSAVAQLQLANSEQLTDAAFLHIGQLTSLAALQLRNCPQLTEEGLTHLEPLSALTRLDLSCYERLTGAGLAHLAAALPQLASLDIEGVRSWTLATEAATAALTQMPQLSSLTFTCHMLSGACLAPLAPLKKLIVHTERGVANHCWTDVDLAELAGGRATLTELSLKSCVSMTDEGLASLAALPLTALNLSACGRPGEGLSDAGLAHLACITSLTSLDLSYGVGFTDAGVAQLAKLTALTELSLFECCQLRKPWFYPQEACP